MKHNSVPGPDGFPAEFFQKFWELIHMDIWNLFKDFYDGNLDIERLNYGMVTLLPKVDNVVNMKNFRPICLLNVCYKIITKVLNNRLASCITKVISDSQYGFIKDHSTLFFPLNLMKNFIERDDPVHYASALNKTILRVTNHLCDATHRPVIQNFGNNSIANIQKTDRSEVLHVNHIIHFW